MNPRTKSISIGLFLIIGLSAILKIYFKTPNIAILFLVVFGAVSGLTTLLVRGFINLPSLLYRIRFPSWEFCTEFSLVFYFLDKVQLRKTHLMSVSCL